MKGFRDSTSYGMFQNLVRYIQQLEQSVRLGLTGEAVRNQALQQLLIKKGVITEAELTEAIGNVIKEANTPKTTEEQPKVELATPTTEQVQAVTQSTTEESKPNA